MRLPPARSPMRSRAARAMPRETATYRIAEIDRALCSRAARSASRAIRRAGWSKGGSGAATGSNWACARWPPRAGLQRASPIPAAPTCRPTCSPARPQLAALELPWDGIGAGTAPALFAAVSSSGAGWSGAALFAEMPGGGLVALGPSGRQRATIGRTIGALAPAAPHLLDRINVLDVVLAGADLALTDGLAGAAGDGRQPRAGGRRDDPVRPLPSRSARASGGCPTCCADAAGPKPAIHGHVAGETFVLIDEDLVALDPALVGDAALARIAALGPGRSGTGARAVPARGSHPAAAVSPVHGKLAVAADGALTLAWTRRARGALLWPDAVDTPLNEASRSLPDRARRSGQPRCASGRPPSRDSKFAAALAAQLRSSGVRRMVRGASARRSRPVRAARARPD